MLQKDNFCDFVTRHGVMLISDNTVNEIKMPSTILKSYSYSIKTYENLSKLSSDVLKHNVLWQLKPKINCIRPVIKNGNLYQTQALLP